MSDGLIPPEVDDAETAPTGPLAEVPTDSPGSGGSEHYWRNLIIGGVVLVVLCAAIIVLTNKSNSSDASNDDLAADVVDADLPATTPVDECITELSAWMPWVTGPGSTTDAMAEFGMQAEEYRIITDAWSTYMRQLYQIGKDDAAVMAYDSIDSGCRAMTYPYESGHMPPG